MSELSIIQKIIVWGLPLLFAITVHEVSHGWVANRLGDPTAKRMGRLTLNPIPHIDIVGTIILPITIAVLSGFSFIFGWAKPVPVNWFNLKKPKRDMILVAIAGPFSNLIMAILWAAIAKIGFILEPQTSSIGLFFYLAGLAGIFINIILMVLNLLPIPPLDGSKVLTALLPNRWADFVSRYESYGLFIIILLLATGILNKIIMPPVVFFVRTILHFFTL